MLKFISILLILSTSYLFPLDIDNKTTFTELLSHSQIYKDKSRSEDIVSIQNREFKSNNKTLLPYGYAPKYDVWIKFTLSNTTPYPLQKIIEYDNPMTSYVDFFENNKLKKQDGLLNRPKDKESLKPIFKIKLRPHQSKVFYIKASSTISPLIVKLNLWNVESFNKKNMTEQLILALFFGAIGIIVLYNFIISIATKERSYLYYTLFFATVSFHHLIYKGVASLYLFEPNEMMGVVSYSTFIVALPTIFLALFTQHILELKQYPILNKMLNYLLIIYAIAIAIIQITEAHEYRIVFFLLLLLSSFAITCYALFKKNKKAYFIILGWGLFITSGLFMYLSSAGIFNIYSLLPYYTELSLVLEITFFSLALAYKIKTLNQERIKAKRDSFLLKELNHRVKNSMQTILSILTLQKNKVENKEIKEVLRSTENRVMATAELYALLQIEDSRTVVDTHKYFSSIVNNIEKSFRGNRITTHIQSPVIMRSEYAVYCGLIVNEAVTNAFKYAFSDRDNGKIEISLHEEQENYHLVIKDNGKGFEEGAKEGLGLTTIIDTLAIMQLAGSLNIDKHGGVTIDIIWRRKE